jgi:hypothetical protein
MQDLLRGRSLTFLKVAALTLAVALCAGCDQVEVTELVSSHQSPVPGTGTVVTVRIRVHNKSYANLYRVMVDVNIPNVAPLASLFREFADIPSGGFYERSYSFVPKTGMDIITGCVDPTNALRESEEERRNNCRSIDLTLYATQELDYQTAGRSGAGFADGIDGSGGCPKIGQGDAKRLEKYGNGQTGVVFVADCFAVELEGVPLGFGGRANPEVFQNFRLVNGWTVSSFETKFNANPTPPGVWFDTLNDAKSSFACSGLDWARSNDDFALNTPPTIGSDNPFMKAHLWAEPGCYLAAHVKVFIRGPSGTDPYGPVTDPCFSGYSGGVGVVFNCSGNQDCAAGFTCINGCCARD